MVQAPSNSDAGIYGLTTTRLEALSDGVLAIVITLLVLGFADTSTELANDPHAHSIAILQHLASLWPRFLGYGLSFVLIAVYCLMHHLMFHYIRRADRGLVWLNVVFLMFAALLPFPTDLLAQCILHESNVIVILYGMAHVATGMTLLAMWWYAARGRRLVPADLETGTVHAIYRTLLVGPAMYVAGAALSFVSIPLAIVIYALVPVAYIFPGQMDHQWQRLTSAIAGGAVTVTKARATTKGHATG